MNFPYEVTSVASKLLLASVHQPQLSFFAPEPRMSRVGFPRVQPGYAGTFPGSLICVCVVWIPSTPCCV